MTTPQAAALYAAQHVAEMAGRGYAVYNPNNKPFEDLPVIYGFNNGGSSSFLSALAMSEDGFVLGEHACSAECYMPHDLGILEGSRKDRHEESYQKHFPDGYRMEFVSYNKVDSHGGLQKALNLANERQSQNKEKAE